MKLLFFIFIINIFINLPLVEGQRNLSPMARQAIDLFKQDAFIEAATIFEKLLQRYPADPLYQYFLAASLLESNSVPDRAIDLLKSSLVKLESSEVYYYLALAYYRKYNFNQANEYFQKATVTSSNKQLICKGLKSKIPSLSELQGSFSSNLKKICIQKSQTSIDSISNAICKYLNSPFVDVNIPYEKNNMNCSSAPTLFQFKSVFQNSTQSYDIVVIRFSAKNTETIFLKKPINTEFDEIFPYYNPVDGYLYFSTNRNQYNGFDIYRAKIDTIHFKIYSVERLPFPINSPWHDYFYVTGENTKSYLVSNRETTNKFAIVYTLIDDKSNHSRWVQIQTSDWCKFKNSYFEENKTIENEIISPIPGNKVEEPTISSQSFIDEALIKQRQADSIQLKIRNLKIKLTLIDEDEKRKKIFSELKKQETNYKQIQAEVNHLYGKISENQNIKALTNETNQDKTDIKIKQSEFSVLAFSPYSATNPIPENNEFPPGLIYTIQIGAFSKKVVPDFFSGIQPIMAEFLMDKNIYKYYAGIFRNFSEADSGLQKVRSLGFKEAFIVSFYDNKKIPINRAKELEKMNVQ